MHEPESASPDPQFLARARAHWTDERTAKVTGGRGFPILPGPGAGLLRALGLLNRDATMPADAVRKYAQVNHLVLLLEPSILELTRRFPTVHLLDAGCGSSYLTYLLAFCFNERWRHPAEIVGVDVNAKVIEKCRLRLASAGLVGEACLAKVEFREHSIRDFEWPRETRPHAVFALHACDTATDEALAFGIRSKSDLLAVAPCCHAELAQHWATLARDHAPGPLRVVWNAPHLRRDAAATLTDALRTLLVRGCGYEVTPTEFVPSEHTPKNTMLRAVRRGNFHRESLQEYAELRALLGEPHLALERSLPEEHADRLPAGSA